MVCAVVRSLNVRSLQGDRQQVNGDSPAASMDFRRRTYRPWQLRFMRGKVFLDANKWRLGSMSKRSNCDNCGDHDRSNYDCSDAANGETDAKSPILHSRLPSKLRCPPLKMCRWCEG